MSNLHDETDDTPWVRRVQDGDVEAFQVLVRRYQTPVYNLLVRWLDSRDDAADVAQDVFVAAFRAIGKYRGEAKFSTWLFQIAINHAKNRRKALGRAAAHAAHNSDDPEGSLLERVPDPSPDPLDRAEQRERQRLVQDAINELESHDALVVILRDIQEQSYEDIARVLDVPEGTVKSRLYRARQALKKRLLPWMTSERMRS